MAKQESSLEEGKTWLKANCPNLFAKLELLENLADTGNDGPAQMALFWFEIGCSVGGCVGASKMKDAIQDPETLIKMLKNHPSIDGWHE